MGRGFAEDVRLAVALDVTDVVPVLRDGVFVVDAYGDEDDAADSSPA